MSKAKLHTFSKITAFFPLSMCVCWFTRLFFACTIYYEEETKWHWNGKRGKKRSFEILSLSPLLLLHNIFLSFLSDPLNQLKVEKNMGWKCLIPYLPSFLSVSLSLFLPFAPCPHPDLAAAAVLEIAPITSDYSLTLHSTTSTTQCI